MKKYPLLPLLIIGVFLRLGYVLALPDTERDPDEPDYVLAAVDILHNRSFEKTVEFHVPPVVPVLYAGLFAFSGPGVQAARVFQCFLFVPLGWVLYRLGREIRDEQTGLTAALFASVYPYFIFYCGLAMTEATAAVVIPATLLCALRAIRTCSLRDRLVFGVVLAINGLTRAAALYFVGLVPLTYLLATGWRNREWVKASAITVGAAFLILAPWLGILASHMGRPIPNVTYSSGKMLYESALRMRFPDPEAWQAHLTAEVYPKYYRMPGATLGERLEGDRTMHRKAMEMIRDNPLGYGRVILFNFGRFWQFYPHSSDKRDAGQERQRMLVGLLSYGLLFPFFLFGSWLAIRDLRRTGSILIFICYYTAVHALLYGKLRYRIPMDSLILVLAAWGFVSVASRPASRCAGRTPEPAPEDLQ